MERYNSETDTWSQVAEMTARRSGAGVGVLNNILYAVGGHDGPLVRKSVEAYDPETNKWHSVADMSFCRRNAGVVAHAGMLYVIGGDDGTSNLSSVEVGESFFEENAKQTKTTFFAGLQSRYGFMANSSCRYGHWSQLRWRMHSR